VQEGLTSLGIAFAVEPRLVRGARLLRPHDLRVGARALESAQNAIVVAVRYDGLAELLGGPRTPGIGFGSGIERILLACDAEGAFPVPTSTVDVFVVDVAGGGAARDLTAELRRAGIRADRAFGDRSMKAQMKLADRSGAALALLVGATEAAGGTVTLRRMAEGGGQLAVARTEVVAEVRSALAPGAGP
jgi:histidyl-tRNA synthetase